MKARYLQIVSINIGMCFGMAALATAPLRAADVAEPKSIFAKDNLVAWCIVPFDAKNRGPEERAEMLNRLGITKVAYDWRQQHIPTFEEEILQYKKHNLDFFAFWGWHPSMTPLVKKHGIKPQIWSTMPSPSQGTQAEKVEGAARAMLPLVEQARQLDCQLGLYNHGGWGGEPENLVAVTQWLRENAKADHVGIVYNFHHGHTHLARMPEVFDAMVPYLMCVNLNGLTVGGPKILPLGQGKEDLRELKIIRDSGYKGPIGILDHRDRIDAEQSLKENLCGLKGLLKELGDEAALRTF